MFKLKLSTCLFTFNQLSTSARDFGSKFGSLVCFVVIYIVARVCRDVSLVGRGPRAGLVQSTLVISKSRELSEILLEDIRTSTYQICRIVKKINSTVTFQE